MSSPKLRPPIGRPKPITKPLVAAYLTQVTVTQIAPLLVTYNGTPNVPASKIAGATYSLGIANAILPLNGQLIVLPIG